MISTIPNISLKNLAMLDNTALGFTNIRITKAHVAVMKKLRNLKTLQFWGSTDHR